MLLTITLYLTSNQTAFGAATPDGTAPPSGSCTNTCVSEYRGGTWLYYPFEGDKYYDPATQTITIGGTSLNVSDCIEAGGTGYYRSGLVWYKKGTNTPVAVGGDYLRGLLNATSYANTGDTNGHTPYWTHVPGAQSWATVRSNFLTAQAMNATNGLTWPNVSMFCYNPAWSGDTPPRPTPSPASGNGHFWSQSVVTAVPSGDVPSNITATTPIDGTGSIQYSTDQETVNVSFQHILGYNNKDIPLHQPHCESGPCQRSHDNQYSNAETPYYVESFQAGNKSNVTAGSYASPANNSQQTSVSNTVPVTLAPGETKTVCQTIIYSKKNFTFTENHRDLTGTVGTRPNQQSWTYRYYEYISPQPSGQGSSQVCATITRPSEPTGSPSSTGTADSTLMFTGEDATIGWSTQATNYPTRKLLEWEAVTYTVPVTQNNWSSLTTGTIGDSTYTNTNHNTRDTCSWYSSRGTIENCKRGASSDGSTLDLGFNFATHTYGPITKTVVVPDLVGYKYCNSFGYRYAYYYYTSNDGQWHTYNPPYWNIFNATCRTIAKKPSTAVWNSSLMSLGGAKTSLAYRYDNAQMGLVAGGQNRTLYGSWSEFLDVINSNVTGLTSGGSLAVGSKRHNGTDICRDVLANNNSPLTIANSDCGNLGHSGVVNNSTFLTRLNTYLKNNDSVNHISASQLGTNMTGTNVVRHTGDLNITGNITTVPGQYNINQILQYNSIYQIPQVIIFVDNGNVNISSNVTQIDAWIIAPNGTINTCSDFQNGVTEADAIRRSYGLCTQQLVFNGPVMASNLRLNRSFGSDPNINYRFGTFGAPSSKQAVGEVFNLRADTYLWAYAQAGRYDSSYTDSYTRELAPRY